MAKDYVEKFGGDEAEVAEKFLDMLRHLSKKDLISERAGAKRRQPSGKRAASRCRALPMVVLDRFYKYKLGRSSNWDSTRRAKPDEEPEQK